MTRELVRFRSIYHHVDQRDLFFNLEGSIYNTDKIGLIGQNGSGKTTFLKMIVGEIDPYRGRVELETGSIGYIPQILNKKTLGRAYSLSVYDFCMYLNTSLYKDYLIMSKYEKGEVKSNDEYLDALGNFQEIGGYEYHNYVNKLLKIAGFSNEEYSQLFSTLSEGQKRLIYIISMMALSKELLIMDEPTNHVDSELKQKYVKLIKEYKGAILVVSHDRELLSQACNKIWEIEDKLLHTYNGNWELYKVEHKVRLKARIARYTQTEKKIERLEDLESRIRKGEADGGKNGSKLRMVAKAIIRNEKRLDYVEPTIEKPKIQATVSYEGKYSDFMLRLKDFNLYINDGLKIKNLNIDVKFGDKVALKGSNGTGKSTIIKLILEKCDYARYEGDIKLGGSAQIGYFSQTLDIGDENVSLIEYIRKLFQCDETKAHGLMNKYLFAKEQKNQYISEMSGGEKNRLQLMNLVEGNYNLLLLDEPTNHLDIYAIEKLEEILQNFNGSILLISHDKYFVEAVTNREVNLNEYNANE